MTWTVKIKNATNVQEDLEMPNFQYAKNVPKIVFSAKDL